MRPTSIHINDHEVIVDLWHVTAGAATGAGEWEQWLGTFRRPQSFLPLVDVVLGESLRLLRGVSQTHRVCQNNGENYFISPAARCCPNNGENTLFRLLWGVAQTHRVCQNNGENYFISPAVRCCPNSPCLSKQRRELLYFVCF